MFVFKKKNFSFIGEPIFLLSLVMAKAHQFSIYVYIKNEQFKADIKNSLIVKGIKEVKRI